MQKQKEQITKNMLIGEVLNKHPELVGTFLENGMQCIGCSVATWETIEQAAAGHGIDADQLVKALNKAVGGGS